MTGPNTMTTGDLDAWGAKFEIGWRSRDPEAIAALFTEDAWYRQGPFAAPIIGREAILAQWTTTLNRQGDPQVWVSEPILAGDRAAAEWWCVAHDPVTGVPRTAAGCVTVWFAPDGRCRGLHEYWHGQPDTALPPHGTWPHRRAETETR
ncbi:nuclear transport factor 2 family protein [Nocardia sp. NPDC051570]|uniref:nuclear transport factor 2 family protein n=1 Tax=Nocardia sp. NPDC051570 TaxID=3364324 RepID=UPI0037AF388D